MKSFRLPEAVASLDLQTLLSRIENIRIAILGDLCLDIYWDADMRQSELSRETPHFPLPIISERFSLGGASNVCANAAALGAQVSAIGVVGEDWRGTVLERCCKEQGIEISCLAHDPSRFTNAYCKPIRHGISDVAYEDPRLDFCTLAPIGSEAEEQILCALDHLKADILCVSDQLRYGCVTERVRSKIIQMAEAGLRVIVDSRDRIGMYRHVWLKPNEVEGYAALHGTIPPEVQSLEDYAACAEALAQKAESSVLMTLGGQGCLCAGQGEICHVEAAKTPAQIDFVGAGDTMLASLSLALATGAAPAEAMAFANLCASVTIAKIGVTGTASRPEVLAAAKSVCSNQ